MNGKCAKCGKEGEMPIYDCGIEFCSCQCQKLYRYKPLMTEATFEEDIILDEIDIDNRTTMYLETTDGFYALYSHYKAIITLHRGLCKPKQVGSYHTLKSAQEDWNKYKQKHGLKSWADKNMSFILSVSKGES